MHMEKLNLIKNIYTYVLSGVMLIIFLVSLINTLTSIPDLIYPSPYLSTYSEFKSMNTPVPAVPGTPVVPTKSEDQIKQEWQERNNQALRDEKIRLTKDILKSSIWTIVSLGAYLYFHRDMKRKD